MKAYRTLRPALGWIALALVLNACAGGGGGGGNTGGITTPPPNTNGNPPPPPPPPPPSSPTADSFRTAEYQLMGALDAIHAADAYAAGYTGRGVTIGIVDFNFDLSSSEVSFAAASVGPNAQMQSIYVAQFGQALPTDQHGQAVASTAAAIKNDIGVHGIAFDSKVLAVDYFSDVNETQIAQGGVLYHVSDPWTYITSNGVRIINTSFGYEANSGGGLQRGIHEAYVLQSSAQAVVNGALLVASAGNGSNPSPSQSNIDILSDMTSAGVINASGSYIDNLGGAFIIAGAVDSNNQIAFFSDRAGSGIARNFYLVAPGVNLILPWNGSLTNVSGTSFSAPLISGAAAVLMQRWPTLTPRQIAQILFATATDLGAPGVDSIYGNGLLNLNAAIQPVGTTSFVTTGGIVANTVTGSGIVLANAFGDAPSLRAALTSVTMFDAFARDFQIDASRMVAARPSLPDRFAALEQKLAWHGASYQIGLHTQFTYNVRSDPEDSILPMRQSFGPQVEPTHQAMFQLTGAQNGFAWTAGSGLSLSDALTAPQTDDPFSTAALTEAFRPALAAPGMFASTRFALDTDTGVSFGLSDSENQGITDHLRTSYRNSAQSAALRLDRAMTNADVALELGDTLQTGGLMGSLASGSLKMADQSSTAWATLSADAPLSAHWLLKGAFTAAAASAAHPNASLITEVGPVLATSFSFGLGGNGIFMNGDALSFTLDQPLHAEKGAVTLVTGVGRDNATGALMMAASHASLVPSGREIALETGYRFSPMGWNAGANLAFAHDADNISGRDDVTGLFWFSRNF